jgi:hypothetical protein
MFLRKFSANSWAFFLGIKMNEDKRCWNCGYLGNLWGITFMQDFMCEWFAVHKKEEAKILYPKKNLDDGCKFWKERIQKKIESLQVQEE